MKRWKARLVIVILLGGALMMGALPACGGSGGEAAPIQETPQTVTPAPEVPETSPDSTNGSADLFDQGKLLYDETAGGVGCALCHGPDARGISAPDIRGLGKTEIRAAIGGGAPAMSFIALTEEELDAVVTYLDYLSEQP